MRDRKSDAESLVVKEKGEPLLSKSTARELGVLNVGVRVNALQSHADLKRECAPVFQGVGKLKSQQ